MQLLLEVQTAASAASVVALKFGSVGVLANSPHTRGVPCLYPIMAPKRGFYALVGKGRCRQLCEGCQVAG